MKRLLSPEMATTTPRFGIDHPTVVPINFDPEDARLLENGRESERESA